MTYDLAHQRALRAKAQTALDVFKQAYAQHDDPEDFANIKLFAAWEIAAEEAHNYRKDFLKSFDPVGEN